MTRKLYIPTTEAARRLGVSSDALRRRLRQRQVKGKFVMGRWLVDALALELSVERQAVVEQRLEDGKFRS